MNLCSRCKKNPAVIFIAKIEGNETKNEGLCLSCAKELGIAPINQMMENLGIKEEDIDSLNDNMKEFMENLEDGGADSAMELFGGNPSDPEGGAPAAPFDTQKRTMARDKAIKDIRALSLPSKR